MTRKAKPSISDLVVEQLPLDAISRYPGNPRRNAASVRKIADSIRQYGFKQPIVVDRDRVIIIGDGRYQAATLMDLETVPVVVADDLSEAKARALRLADNRIGEDSEWDDEKLVREIIGLSEMNFDVRNTGFEDLQLADMLSNSDLGNVLRDPDDLGDQNAAAGAGADDDAALPPLVSQPGDIWQLGSHRLACGDNRSPDLVAALLAGARPAIMVTDPPYGVSYDASWRKEALGMGGDIATGKVTNDHLFDWRATWALFPGDIAYVYHASVRTAEVVASLRAVGFEVRQILVWVKSRHAIGRGHYHPKHEPLIVATRDLDDLPFTEAHESIAYVVKKGETADWQGGRKQNTVWEIPHVKSETGHSKQKPVEAMRRPIVNHTLPGDLVYEPFSGSGTTLIAAEITERVCYALELEPKYVDLAVRRWQSFTGKKAKLVESGGEKADAGKQFDSLVKKRKPAAVDSEE